MSSFRSLRSLTVVAAAAILASACGSDGPTYPTVFEPDVLASDVQAAASALGAPAAQSFVASGYAIDDALFGLDGGAFLTAPALMLENEAAGASRVATRILRTAELRTADAIPAAALGKTFTWDSDLGVYVESELTGAPANGVRFHLYLMDAEFETPVLPLVQTGYVDLTRTVTNDRATARVQVYTGTVNPSKVIDYSATISGSVTAPTVSVLGFAKNAADSLGFVLTTSISAASETITVDWRTALPSRGLSSRLVQSFSFAEQNVTFAINAFVQSASGRVDLIGDINLAEISTLQVRVYGRQFATLTFDPNAETPPTFLNASGQPLTAEEEAALEQIFEWFSESFEVYAVLLSPVTVLLDQ
jgi:hypothetical protein